MEGKPRRLRLRSTGFRQRLRLGQFESLEQRNLLATLAWYKNDSISSLSTVLADSSGNSQTGTLSGSYSSTGGEIGGALNLTGGIATLPTDIVHGVADFTVSAWVKVNTVATNAHLWDFGTGTTSYMYVMPNNSSGNVQFGMSITGSSAANKVITTTPIAAGGWHFIVVTLAGTTATVYVDGASVGTNTAMTLTPSSLGTTTQNYIGKSQFSTDPTLKGAVDDMRLFDTALSAATVTTMYNDGVAAAAAIPSALVAVANAGATGGNLLHFISSSNLLTGYVLERAPDASFGTGVVSVNIPSSQVNYTDNDVFAGTTYFYRVTALLSNGSTAGPAIFGAVADQDFEIPSLGTGTAAFGYQPTGTNWTFTGNAGIAADGSGFNVVAGSGHGGSQVALLQSAGSGNTNVTGKIVQSFNFIATGNYTVSFKAADRLKTSGVLSTQGINVFLDSSTTPLYAVVPGSSTFASNTTPSFNIATAGVHAISFVGSVDAGDQTAFIDDVTVNLISGATPTVATATAATPSPVTGLTTNLSVLGADDGTEANLNYTWSTTGTPPAPVTFSKNSTNAAKNTVATFSKAGTYNLLVTISDASAKTVTSSVTVTVNQTLTSIAVTPSPTVVYVNGTRQFAALANDQFGNAMASQPSFTWSKTGVGSISSSGLYTASATTGNATVNATVGSITSNTAQVTVLPPVPSVVTNAAATPSPVTGTTAALSVTGTDPLGEPSLTYTWSLNGTPPAAVNYSINGTNAAKNTTVTFTKAGTYSFTVTLRDTTGATATSVVSVPVSQTLTNLTISPASTTVATSGTKQFTAAALDQFGAAFTTPPTFTWSSFGNAGATGNTAVGSVNSGGLFTASSTNGTATVSVASGGFVATAQLTVGSGQIVNGTASLTTLGTNAYFTADTNSCAIATDNIWTDAASGYQFAAYYTTTPHIIVARRQLGSATWQTFDTGLTDPTVSDDHDVISIAVDSDGYMHVSWGMHNISLLYGISDAKVTTPTLSSITFTLQDSTNAPTLFPNSGNDTNEVTYPQFYSIPNSTKLLFVYRNGGAGGGSGNGNEYVNVYDPATKTFAHTFMVNGIQTSVNAYLNRLVYDSTGTLLATWTWRATANWQTNSNIMFGQSPDNGSTWFKQAGSTQYTLPIIQTGTPAASVAQVIETIPQNSSFINQTSMTVDNNNNPLVATFLAPNAGNPNRQYVLYYYSGGQWKTTQVSSRTSDTAVDSSGANVRDLGRPLVLVDHQGRVLVVTRSQDTSMGGYSSTSVPNNVIKVYYCTNLSSATPTWSTVVLNTTDMGNYEPTYDQNLWQTQNKLSLFFEPTGLSGQASGTAQILDWNEQAFFYTPPTIVNAAAATPSPVTGTTTAFSALGSTGASESTLTYTWATTGTPPAPVTFGTNGTNAAKNTNATFTQPGTYNFQVTIADATGLNSTSTVSVNVVSTAASVSVSPAGQTVTVGNSLSYSASFLDQFGHSVSPTGSIFWSTTGSNTIDSSGLFTAATTPGSATITATLGSVTGNTSATVALPSFSVTNLNDSGSGSLRQAILDANTTSTFPGTINVNVSGAVQLSSQLPDMVNGETLNLTAGNFSVGTANSFTFGEFPSLTVSGNGVLTLGGTQTHSSPTSINITAGGLTLNSDAGTNVTITSAAPLIFGSSQHLSALSLTGGSAMFNGSGKLLVTSTLTVNPTAALDLGSNKIIVHATTGTLATTLSYLTGLLATGFGNGGVYWGGYGINSSSARNDLGRLTAIGVMSNTFANARRVATFGGEGVSATDVLLRYTYYGDANLDGTVNGSDYAFTDNGFNFGLAGWTNGDFDYSGAVSAIDYAIIDNAYTFQGSPLSGTPLAPLSLSLPVISLALAPSTTAQATATVDQAITAMFSAPSSSANVDAAQAGFLSSPLDPFRRRRV